MESIQRFAIMTRFLCEKVTELRHKTSHATFTHLYAVGSGLRPTQDFVSNINARTKCRDQKTQGDVTLTFIECLQEEEPTRDRSTQPSNSQDVEIKAVGFEGSLEAPV